MTQAPRGLRQASTARLGTPYRDDFSNPEDRIEVYRLLHDVFDVDVSPLRDLDLWGPTYKAFSYLDTRGQCVANVATCVLRLVVNGQPVEAMGSNPSPRDPLGALAA